MGLIFIAVAGISAGCSTRAEVTKKTEPPVQKKEAPLTTRTPGVTTEPDPYAERQFDGDLEYPTPPARTKSSAKLTQNSFEKIKMGMTLDEVEKILGEKGMLVSTMSVNGRKTLIYKWSNDNYTSYIDVTIENGRIVEKKDKGLK